MNFYLLIALLCCIVIIIFMLVRNSKKQKESIQYIDKLENLRSEELKQYFREEWEEKEKELEQKVQIKEKSLEKQWTDAFQKHQLQLSNLDKEILNLETVLSEKEKRYEEVNQDLEVYKKGKIKEIDSAAAEYEQRKRLENAKAIEEHNNSMKKASAELQEQLLRSEQVLKDEIETIKSELEVERRKRAAINEELRKAEEKEKYNEIHSVQLTDNEKEDIHFLLSLEDKLHNKQVLYKLVWSTYLQQAYKNTFHNILGNRDPRNVIYCIENINTGKKYIGKTSAEVSKRWTEHIKTSLNIGSIKTTNIHKALYNHWDEFIFYILAETEKEKLSEMEKYYINFYESDKYGYNIKAGG